MEIDDTYDPDLSDEEKRLLRLAGASEELITYCEFDIASMERTRSDGKTVTRNTVLAEVKKYLRGMGDIPPSIESEKDAKEFKQYGEQFFENVWKGNLYAALQRADPNNSAILLELFGPARINEDRPHGFPEVEA